MDHCRVVFVALGHCRVVLASLTGPSVGFSVETWAGFQALGVVVHEAPLPAIRVQFGAAFAVTGFAAHVSIARAVLQCT